MYLMYDNINLIGVWPILDGNLSIDVKINSQNSRCWFSGLACKIVFLTPCHSDLPYKSTKRHENFLLSGDFEIFTRDITRKETNLLRHCK